MRSHLFVLAAALLLLCPLASQATHRSKSEIAAFKREQPCPATGQRRGSCPGYVIDHHVALCVGGKDRPENMRWMTAEAAKRKDRWECRPGWQQHMAACERSGSC